MSQHTHSHSKYIRTICLPSGSVEEDVNSFQNQLAATTIGWGKLYEHGRVFRKYTLSNLEFIQVSLPP